MTHDPIKVARPQVGEEEAAVVREVLLSGKYVSGERVEAFEKKFAAYIGVDYAVAVNSGTAALHIALEALGVGKGDEVIVPPLTFFATVSSVLYLGAMPVFADIDRDDLCLSPKGTEKLISSKTRAIIVVHLFGAPAKMDAFSTIASQYGIPVLEDCAQAHGSEFDGRRVGGIGKAGAFSFFATKHMTTGEGGMITTCDARVAEAGRVIRNHGMAGRDAHVRLGFNNRMTEMEAAMGLVQLEKLDVLNEKRIANSRYLISHMEKIPWAHVPQPSTRGKHTYFWCPLMVDEMKTGKTIEDLKQHLRENHIEFRHRYQEPVHRQAVLGDLGVDCAKLHFPNAEAIAGKIIGLPNHPELTEKDLDRIVRVLKSF